MQMGCEAHIDATTSQHADHARSRERNEDDFQLYELTVPRRRRAAHIGFDFLSRDVHIIARRSVRGGT